MAEGAGTSPDRTSLASDTRRQTVFVSSLFAGLTLAQIAALVVFGTGRWGFGIAVSLAVVGNLVALASACGVYRRAQGVAAIFWFLFAIILVVWVIPTSIQAYDTLFAQNTLSESSWRLLYCLYGAPILMIIFLPDSYQRAYMKSEVFLDLFQISIVVALAYSTFFFLPLRQMLPDDAFLHSVSISDMQSVFLLSAILLRLQFARAQAARDLLRRFAAFLIFCAVATLMSDWIDRHHYHSAAVWFSLVWMLNMAVPALLAITWLSRAPEAEEQEHFASSLATNLALVAMLVTLNLLMDRWKQANGALLTNIAIIAFLFAFTLRLALTQYHQWQEIRQRKAAQEQVSKANQKISCLLEEARRQTVEITQISELGSLLQACSSREEIFRLVPERLRRLFPDASGSIFLLTASKNRVETVAPWGIGTTGHVASPSDCWALRRGTIHIHPPGASAARCPHFLAEGASICIPLVANGEAIGILAIQDNGSAASEADAQSNRMARNQHLARAVAEHIALAVANLGLRESLRVQAIRDPLTGLYNRRYMQEFLERELHAARRKQRPVAVLMLDLDHFKRFNDTFGHSAGDRALASIAEILQRSVRVDDVACRYGGEEFTLILPECSLQQAMIRAESIRARVAESHSQREGNPADPITVSLGVAAFPETTDRVDLLLKLADEALYQAKREGRNRVIQARAAFTSEHDSLEQNSAAASTSS
ncbi:MAG TPA: sensor domain-containing diguanylate cyclase [Terriglobales bacterium]|nr:sensor domain-containing diguanylate cyclase [Terriglobales bacterium]